MVMVMLKSVHLFAHPRWMVVVLTVRCAPLVALASTMFELQLELKAAIENLMKHTSSLSVVSGCELFTRFVTRTSLEIRVRGIPVWCITIISSSFSLSLSLLISLLNFFFFFELSLSLSWPQ
jgi:hypothetical protein